ncbi:GCN5-related N-acetyltransferase [Gloeothece citriformis PCC 7424]|uniref:GCN5-related N-acetyltransferase n=1 Tax=Gloeothece citriformis (strain PCC 7424) TaxID=65393 RepID=B7KIB3_GLOC7|nr:GNAT family N-acetyltransferase [Gloeothece citriformis]ACK73600.1 GCN5-related N-acetyltransferase [Gloeothece citriformis PCC 7424]
MINSDPTVKTTDPQFLVRPMTLDDLKIALSWAQGEGWNPGIDDADNYYIADPGGFLIGELNGNPISCISVIRYNDNFNFIGIYIVKPDYRNQGYGLKTFQEALKLVNNKPAALDGVLQQVNNYQKWGFKSAHYHRRYQGIIQGQLSEDVIDLTQVNFDQLCNYDHQYFPGYRPQFLKKWIHQPHGQGYAIVNQEKVLGYGVIREACEGFKIAPLFAENEQIAEKLVLALSTYTQGNNIYIDVPDLNQKAISLVETYQMQCVFECVRMYTHNPPNLDWNKIFGVTGLEIG